ncbi:hypothetical protein F4779DRAFT_624477, partial [Xylariaceae sp. FL0662B]
MSTSQKPRINSGNDHIDSSSSSSLLLAGEELRECILEIMRMLPDLDMTRKSKLIQYLVGNTLIPGTSAAQKTSFFRTLVDRIIELLTGTDLASFEFESGAVHLRVCESIDKAETYQAMGHALRDGGLQSLTNEPDMLAGPQGDQHVKDLIAAAKQTKGTRGEGGDNGPTAVAPPATPATTAAFGKLRALQNQQFENEMTSPRTPSNKRTAGAYQQQNQQRGRTKGSVGGDNKTAGRGDGTKRKQKTNQTMRGPVAGFDGSFSNLGTAGIQGIGRQQGYQDSADNGDGAAWPGLVTPPATNWAEAKRRVRQHTDQRRNAAASADTTSRNASSAAATTTAAARFTSDNITSNRQYHHSDDETEDVPDSFLMSDALFSSPPVGFARAQHQPPDPRSETEIESDNDVVPVARTNEFAWLSDVFPRRQVPVSPPNSSSRGRASHAAPPPTDPRAPPPPPTTPSSSSSSSRPQRPVDISAGRNRTQ